MDARRFTDRAKIRVNFLTISLVVEPPSNITPGFYPGRVRGVVVNGTPAQAVHRLIQSLSSTVLTSRNFIPH